MSEDDNAAAIAEADKQARRARFWEVLYAVIWPLFCAFYLITSKEPTIERVVNVIIVSWSGIALVGTYGSKKEAALSKKAGYENP